MQSYGLQFRHCAPLHSGLCSERVKAGSETKWSDRIKSGIRKYAGESLAFTGTLAYAALWGVPSLRCAPFRLLSPLAFSLNRCYTQNEFENWYSSQVLPFVLPNTIRVFRSEVMRKSKQHVSPLTEERHGFDL